MAHMVKCYFCGERFDRDKIPYAQMRFAKRYAHQNCYQKALEEKKIKDLEPPLLINPSSQRICTYCGKPINLDDEPWEPVSGSLVAHKACADAYKLMPISEQDELYEYIEKIFNIDACSPAMRRLLTLYHEKDGYTYSGMKKALQYIFEVKHLIDPYDTSVYTLEQKLGMIHYYYKQAYNYYLSIWEANQINKEKDMNEYKPKVIEVHITPPERKVEKRQLFTFLDEEVDE